LHEPFIEKEILYRLNELCKDLPFFVKIHQTESDDDNIYLVLEYCSGGTLEHFALSNCACNSDNNLDSAVIKKIAAKILLIMEKLHSYGIVHRDLKVPAVPYSLLTSSSLKAATSSCLTLALPMRRTVSSQRKSRLRFGTSRRSVRRTRRRNARALIAQKCRMIGGPPSSALPGTQSSMQLHGA
jgi:serine/threonine protein kinase